MSSPKAHINWIDGLKGISAVIVLLCHLRLAFKTVVDDNSLMYTFPLNILFSGGLAVSIFIVMSAMIMTIQCADASRWHAILVKRYFRFVLPITAVLCVYWLFCYAGLLYNNTLAEEIDNMQLMSSYSLRFKTIIKSILLSPIGGGSQYLGVLWMLKYVFLSPVFAILLDLLLSNLKPLPELLCIVLICYIFHTTDPYFLNVIYGFLLIHIPDKYGNRILIPESRKRWYAILLFCLFLSVVYFHSKVESLRLHNAAFTTLQGCLLVAVVCLSPLSRRILSMNIFRYLGKISFEIYLLHLIVIYSLSCYMYMSIPAFEHRMLIVWAVAIIVTLVMSWIWNKYVNHYINRCIDNFTNDIFRNNE